MGFNNYMIKIGGFSGINSGKILHSYSVSKIGKFKNKCGFCYQNSGEIDSCFADSLSNKIYLDSFCLFNSGNITHCFNNTNNISENNETNDEPVENSAVLCNFSKTNLADLISDYGFTLSEHWSEITEDSDNLLSLELKNNIYDLYTFAQERGLEKISIQTREQLCEITSKIESGDEVAASAYYVLEKDIDLKGKSWTPIGSILSPFRGVFDGCGHKIYNFKVTNKSLIFAGFFGVIENAVIGNLSVDGIVKTGRYTGGFVGMNRDSKIYSCCAVCQVVGHEHVGGFVGNNAGIIEGCYYNGKIKKTVPNCLDCSCSYNCHASFSFIVCFKSH